MALRDALRLVAATVWEIAEESVRRFVTTRTAADALAIVEESTLGNAAIRTATDV